MTTHPAERFAIVPLSTPGRTPDDAIVVGPLSEVTEYIGQSISRQDAVEQLNRARFSADQIAGLQEKTRGVQVSMVAEATKHLDTRLSAFNKRRADAARARADAEAEAEAKRIETELASLPDPDDPNAASNLPDPSLAPETSDEAPAATKSALSAHGDPPGDPPAPNNPPPGGPTGELTMQFGADEVEFPMGEDPDLDPDLPRAPVAAGFDEA